MGFVNKNRIYRENPSKLLEKRVNFIFLTVQFFILIWYYRVRNLVNKLAVLVLSKFYPNINQFEKRVKSSIYLSLYGQYPNHLFFFLFHKKYFVSILSPIGDRFKQMKMNGPTPAHVLFRFDHWSNVWMWSQFCWNSECIFCPSS